MPTDAAIAEQIRQAGLPDCLNRWLPQNRHLNLSAAPVPSSATLFHQKGPMMPAKAPQKPAQTPSAKKEKSASRI